METYNDNLQEEIIIVIAVLSGIHICDWACKNRAYLHMKFDLIFELQLTISFKVQMLLQ